MVVAAQVIVILELRRCVQQRHLLLEHRRDAVSPTVVSGQGPAARDVHHDVIGVQFKEARKVAGIDSSPAFRISWALGCSTAILLSPRRPRPR
jgi:hypothetical protein